MSVTLKPGDVLEMHCPAGSLPQVTPGQQFPVLGKDKNYVIISVDGDKVVVGPLRGGQIDVDIACSDEKTAHESFELQPTPPAQLPPRAPPQMPIAVGLPGWFWLALALGIAVICAAIYGIARRLGRRKKPASLKREIRPPSGDEIMEIYLRTAEGARWAEKNEAPITLELYAKGNDALRSFLEHRLHFKASWATTTEFLGTLKSSIMGFSGLSDVGHQVETLLTQADLVRFSKDLPPMEARKAFLASIRKIQGTVLKATREAQP